ncbi:MAG: hypothetical protein ACYDH8_10215 [Syntrophales bacterium]
MNEYIDSHFKWGFIARFCIGMAAISILSVLFFLLILPKGNATFYASLVYAVQKTEVKLVPIIIFVVLFEIILAVLFTLFLTLFLSHRVGGAIFKLEGNIEQLKSGDLNIREMSLRGADQGQILSVKFNEMLRKWHASFKELKYYYGKFSARTNALEKEWFQSEKGNSAAILRIKYDAEKMQAVLDRFII